jgi:hypothetical protein
VQNNNNTRNGFISAKKRSGVFSNLIKRWWDDLESVRRKRVSGLFKRNRMPSQTNTPYLKHCLYHILYSMRKFLKLSVTSLGNCRSL